MAAVLQPAEVQFAQRLASNDKSVRDRAVKKLRKYVTARTQHKTGGFSHDELLKIWKGLFYCIWMQDKPVLQEELANSIAQLIHTFQNEETRHLFLQTFWQTMCREWNGIDRLRMDKFYMLCRFVFRQSLEVLKRSGWDESLVEKWLNLLVSEVMNTESKSPKGIKLHFIDIYLEELARVGAEELTAEQNLKFLEPFCKIASKTKDQSLMQAVVQGIFEAVMDQAPFAIEDLMKKLQEGGEDELSDDHLESDTEQDPSAAKKWTSRQNFDLQCVDKKVANKEEAMEEDEIANHDEDTEDDHSGPVLQFDYKALADRLFALASRSNTPARNRKRLYRLVKKFQDLNEGIFPQDEFPEEVSTDEEEDFEFSRKRKKRKGKREENKQENEQDRGEKNKIKSKKDETNRNMKQQLDTVDSATFSIMAAAASSEGLVKECMLEEVTPGGQPEITKKKRKKKKLKVAKLRAQESELNVETSWEQSDNNGVQDSLNEPQGEKKKLKKKKVRNETVAESLVGDGHEPVTMKGDPVVNDVPLTSRGLRKKKKSKTATVNGDGVPEDGTASLGEHSVVAAVAAKKTKLKKKKLKRMGFTETAASDVAGLRKKKKRKLNELLDSATEANEPEIGSKKIKSNKNEHIQTLIPMEVKKMKPSPKVQNDFVKFEKSLQPTSVFFRKAKDNTASPKPSKQLNKTPVSGSKKVTFGLNKNTTAEFKRTDKSLLVSPEGPSRVAFNPKQKPLFGVLKTPPSTPSNTPEPKRKFLTPGKKRATAIDFF